MKRERELNRQSEEQNRTREEKTENTLEEIKGQRQNMAYNISTKLNCFFPTLSMFARCSLA